MTNTKFAIQKHISAMNETRTHCSRFFAKLKYLHKQFNKTKLQINMNCTKGPPQASFFSVFHILY